ncbi:MAG: endonuclease III [Candidatus Dadabacteria bacterium]|nr:endonuclease III [Candidatus Dadabacteria bacterium]NIS08650.1 endonuclease III [Candidatus Dadabacteria bacterium]NIV42484.1 endonuclease III [Candidatus Dadabacteria bacterium]NIX15366.1 endonuclease III [Candidatus Dadabacteria bacterium]NIY22025.1 endonuclease III [Candidatus Dadabacteria bacterium]
MEDINIKEIVRIIKKEYRKFKTPFVTIDAEKTREPFRVLISTIISLRTRDSTTEEASNRLFKLASTPEDMLKIKIPRIEKALYPAGFYRVKAKTIKEVCRELVKKYDSKVPGDLDELLKLKGVGRKTANLVITLGYNKPGICVDIHVHRIFNRLGYIKTKTPDESEFALRKKLPKRYWIDINSLLVAYGQNICKPVGPKCDICKISDMCGKVGVKK